MAITLRIVLIENMRRVTDQIVAEQDNRQAADELLNLVVGQAKKASDPRVARPCIPRTCRCHASVGRVRRCPKPSPRASSSVCGGLDAAETPLHGWLQECLSRQGLTVDDVVLRAQSQQGASNVTMRNIVTSMRLITEMDWPDFFEDVSPVDAKLRARSDFAAMDFASRNLYRTAIETLALGAGEDGGRRDGGRARPCGNRRDTRRTRSRPRSDRAGALHAGTRSRLSPGTHPQAATNARARRSAGLPFGALVGRSCHAWRGAPADRGAGLACRDPRPGGGLRRRSRRAAPWSILWSRVPWPRGGCQGWACPTAFRQTCAASSPSRCC